MKSYRVIKLEKHAKHAHKDAPDTTPNVMEIRHKVKVVKPWKIMKKLWGFWL
ncbi:MAG TPA: hypothetical protein PK156_00870 [Polyangium sp.]|nr:hypothetical protein [Polyangium sp.]